MPERTEAELAVLDMLAKASEPWVRRSLADLVSGRGVVDGLERDGLIECWTADAVQERRELIRKQVDEKTKQPREVHVGWHNTRSRRTVFVVLTSLGHAATSRDLFETSDCGRPYQAQRRQGEGGEWILPDTPVKSTGRGPGVQLCPDLIPDQGEQAKDSSRGSKRVG